MKCPLCGDDSILVEAIETSRISMLWKRLEMDVSRIFSDSEVYKYKCNKCGLGFYHPFYPGDDVFYGKLAELEWYYKHSGKSEYDFAASIVPENSKLIDVGCGIGEFADYLPKTVYFAGVELSTKSVNIAKSLGRNVFCFDITNPPDGFKGQFDMVTCFQVIEHVTDIDAFFSSLLDLCKPGGKIILAVPNNGGFVGVGINNVLNMPPHHVLLWNESSLRYLAYKYGLTVVKYFEENLSDIHRRWAYSTIVRRYIEKMLCLKYTTIDIGLAGRVLDKVSSVFSLVLMKIRPRMIQVGHSSIIVLKRN